MSDYPSQYLPRPTRDNYGYTPESPMIRTQMVTGRARQRRTYESVPEITTLNWCLTREQAAYFEPWFMHVLEGGSQWFEMFLNVPYAWQKYQVRFIEMYDGPTPIPGHLLWKYSARVELFAIPMIGRDWMLYAPDFFGQRDLFDLAMNHEWPEA